MTRPGTAVHDLVERHPGPAALKFTYVSGFVAFALIRHDARIWSYVFVITVLLVTVAFVHRAARFSRPVAWALAVSGALHMAGGLLPSPQRGVPILYETWLVDGLLKYDQLVHFLGTAVITVACWELLARYLDHTRATPPMTAPSPPSWGVGSERSTRCTSSCPRSASPACTSAVSGTWGGTSSSTSPEPPPPPSSSGWPGPPRGHPGQRRTSWRSVSGSYLMNHARSTSRVKR